MKSPFILIILTTMLSFSCEKPGTVISVTGPLDGSWKMIMATDLTTNLQEFKPSTLEKDVIINFTSVTGTTGKFSGSTPSNIFGENEYSTPPPDGMKITVLVMTEVAETPWGSLFIDNIRDAQKHHFENGNLVITTQRKLLTFQKR